jgi:hypothetical protein
MKHLIFLAALATAFAISTSADAHWRYHRPWGYAGYGYGYGYPGYTTYYPARAYIAPRPVVSYYGPVVRPYYAPRVVTYRPVYTSYYAGPYGYSCGW